MVQCLPCSCCMVMNLTLALYVTVPVPAARSGSVAEIVGTADGSKLSVSDRICPVVAGTVFKRNRVCPMCNQASEDSTGPCEECLMFIQEDSYVYYGANVAPASGTLIERRLIFSPLRVKPSQGQAMLTPKVGVCPALVEKRSKIQSQACRTVVFPCSLSYSSAAALPKTVHFPEPVTFCSQLCSARNFGDVSSAKLQQQSKEIGLFSGDKFNVPPQRRPNNRLKLKKPEVQQQGGMEEEEAFPASRSGA